MSHGELSQPPFQKSRTHIIREAGITNLTRVPIRIALQGIALDRVFAKRGLPVPGGEITRNEILRDINAGINLRNSVAHRGLEVPDIKAVEAFVRAVYFLIETVIGKRNRLISADTATRPSEAGSRPLVAPARS